MLHKLSVKQLAQLGLLVAMEIVLSRFLSISTPIVKIGFGFVPLVVAAMLFGPVWAAAAAALADFLGAVLFPIGAYFPGFTLTAALVGLTYGLLLRKNAGWGRIVAAVAIVSLPLHLGLNTLWVYVISGKAFWALLPARAIQCAIMAPIQVLLIWVVATRLPLLKKRQT